MCFIITADEAHRTQYKSLAENMRQGLPKAQYLAFTGTPLLGWERKTNAWFGDCVSEYNFHQSMDGGYLGKGMVISVDLEKHRLKKIVDYMRRVDMVLPAST